MIGPKRDRFAQVGLPAGERFARRGEDQIERHVQTGLAQVSYRRANGFGPMVAFQHLQLGGVERLRPQADAGYTVFDQNANDLGRDVVRVRLDRKFSAGCQDEPAANGRQQLAQVRRRQMRGCPAANEQGVDRAWGLQQGQLALKRRQVLPNQVVAPGDHREIAIPAMMPAKRHMDVSGARGHRRLRIWIDGSVGC